MPESAGADSQWTRIQELFDAAIDLAPAERAPFLERTCPGDDGLRRQVLSLILSSERAAGKLEDAVQFAAARAFEEHQLAVGERVGAYQLVRQLGTGGMGAVYLAVRADDQYRQQVAIKILHFTLATSDMVERFRNERQILASLDHPNIARLLDGGMTASGLPYVVMEYVDGCPIDQYCASLALRRKLKLFRAVCAALHSAHRALVVHRDIKPGNILVTGDGTVKLLDFGIAKLMSSDAPALTRVAERLLTPEYASPEQIRGAPITTASDIYSLGVLLYELLTGQRPYQVPQGQTGGLEQAICETEAPKPSRRAGNRELAGDLDNIVAMALEKSPARRYASADQLSEDIRRYLEGFPILARPDTWNYRSSKFVRRHKAGAGLGVTFVLLLLAFSAAMALLAQRANRARQTAEQTTQFLVNMFQVSDPSESRGSKLTAREVLDRGAADVTRSLQSQPEVRATLMETIAGVYQNLGLYTEARALTQQVWTTRKELLGPAAPETTRALTRLAELTRLKRDYAAAETLARQSLDLRRKTLGARHSDVAESLTVLAFIVQQRGDLKTAESLFREALGIQRASVGNGPGSGAETAETLSQLGALLQAKGDWEGAQSALTEALEIRRSVFGAPHRLVAISLDKLGQLYYFRRDLPKAETFLRQSLAMRLQLFGENNPETGTNLQNLAHVLQDRGDLEGAKQLYERALTVERATLGDQDIETAIAMSGLASLLHETGDWKAAEALLRETLAVREKQQGENHPSVARARAALGRLLIEEGNLNEAEPLLLRALEIRQRELGENHYETGDSLFLLGNLRAAAGLTQQADALYGKALRILRATNDEQLPDKLRLYGMYLVKTRRASDAEPILREVAGWKRTGGSAWQIASAESDLAACLTAEHKYSEARKLLEQSLPALARSRAGSPEASEARRRWEQLRRAARF